VEFPSYKKMSELLIATRSDRAKIIAVASSRLGLVVQVETDKRSEEMLLDGLLNHTPPDSLSWNEQNWEKVEHLA
jgi:hypothetical protein